MPDAPPPVRRRLRVEGVVQGVGFRPFVFGLAARHRLAGFVLNDAAGVVVEVEGPADAVAAFARALRAEAPPAARVEAIDAEEVAPRGETGFAIVASEEGEAATLVSPDLATCDACRRELFDPRDRRRRYPFLNCTQCGPRFTIVRGVPYDRPRTTMASFEMCAACAEEYDSPSSRRFHAQPNACAACGPQLELWDRDGLPVIADDPLAAAVARLRVGEVVAVKGLGGYHLACDAANARAVEALRARKVREDKPFAVMARDELEVRERCELDDAERALLASPARPIVLLRKREPFTLPDALAPRNRYLGVMLPYTPLHHLLLAEGPPLLVMTSGNRADEPIAYRDELVVEHLHGVADWFLTHDRPIARRVDDSVTRVFRGRAYPLRRSRGYVPLPIALGKRYETSVLAVGAELKNTFCLTRGDRAFVSHHIGDLENEAALASFEEGVADFERLFDVAPAVVARDLHPDYLASRYAERRGLPQVVVQHHHAHVAAVLADAGYGGCVIGVAFDGAGLGDDGAVWGGEFLVGDAGGCERAAHLAYVPLPGGDRAAREPWRMALSWLGAIYGDGGLDAARRLLPAVPPATLELVWQAMRRGVNAPPTSSMGRLFDAVAALAGVRAVSNYEGQAAADLEQLADETATGRYAFALGDASPLPVDAAPVIDAIISDLRNGATAGVISARFHRAVAAMVADVAAGLRDKHGLNAVALGGGVFQNVTLLALAEDRLRDAGFNVLIHAQVPTNDGGLSLGQAAVALARIEKGPA